MIGTILAKLNAPKGIEALNNRDLDTYIQRYAEDATLIFPGDIPGGSGTHHGKKAIYDWYKKNFEQFPGYHITLHHVTISNLFDLVGDNVIMTHWTLDLKNQAGSSGQTEGVTIATVQKGKVIRCEEFLTATSEELHAAWQAGYSAYNPKYGSTLISKQDKELSIYWRVEVVCYHLGPLPIWFPWFEDWWKDNNDARTI